MFRKLLSIALAGLLMGAWARVFVSAQTQASTQLTAAEKTKATVMRLGGGRARVQVRLKNQMKLKGYIGQIGEEGFSLIDPKSGTITPVPYEEVVQVKNINRSPWIGLAIVGGTMGGILLLVALSLRGS